MNEVGYAIVDDGRTCAQSNIKITPMKNSPFNIIACDQPLTAVLCLMLLRSLGATWHERMAGCSREGRQPVELSKSDRRHRGWMHKSNAADSRGLSGSENGARGGG